MIAKSVYLRTDFWSLIFVRWFYLFESLSKYQTPAKCTFTGSGVYEHSLDQNGQFQCSVFIRVFWRGGGVDMLQKQVCTQNPLQYWFTSVWFGKWCSKLLKLNVQYEAHSMFFISIASNIQESVWVLEESFHSCNNSLVLYSVTYVSYPYFYSTGLRSSWQVGDAVALLQVPSLSAAQQVTMGDLPCHNCSLFLPWCEASFQREPIAYVLAGSRLMRLRMTVMTTHLLIPQMISINYRNFSAWFSTIHLDTS